jgi:hypothetical protein
MKLSETWFIHFDISNNFYTLHVRYNELHMLKQFRFWAGIAQLVQPLARGWTVRESSLGGDEIFPTHPDRPWGPPSLLYSGYRVSFPGVNRPGRGVNHPPPSSAEVKERVELYLFSPTGPSWPVHLYLYLYLNLNKDTDLTLHAVNVPTAIDTISSVCDDAMVCLKKIRFLWECYI